MKRFLLLNCFSKRFTFSLWILQTLSSILCEYCGKVVDDDDHDVNNDLPEKKKKTTTTTEEEEEEKEEKKTTTQSQKHFLSLSWDILTTHTLLYSTRIMRESLWTTMT